MPTVSESLWVHLSEKKQRIIDDYVNAVPHTIEDSVHVFRARLHGIGITLRSTQDTEIKLADMAKLEKRKVLERQHAIMVMERGREPVFIRFKNAHAADTAVELLRRQPNIALAAKVVT